MSFHRFVYYSAVVAGWGGLLAWLLAEGILPDSSAPGVMPVAIAGALVGGIIALSLGLVAGFSVGGVTAASWSRHIPQWGVSAGVGVVGGGLGAGLGHALYAHAGLPQALGWAVLGLAVGGAGGVAERSPRKTRNGLAGGGIGGLLGGWLFAWLAASGTEMGPRAVGFVVLGGSIGAFVGLAHVVLREAWLTVLEGFRPGRRLILTQETTILGRGDHLPLPLLGYTARDLESEHARIVRRPGGKFVLEDLGSRLGTVLNGQPVGGPTPLADGDLLRLGGNILQFNVRAGSSQEEVGEAGVGSRSGQIGGVPPERGIRPAAGEPPAATKEGPPWHGGISPPPGAAPGGSAPAKPSGGPRIPPPPPPPGS